MSQRMLIPTNLFYDWRDPMGPPQDDFPVPNTGDTYFNVASQTIRIFYENAWHDAIPQLTGYLKRTDLIVETAAPSGAPPNGGIVNTVHIQY